MMAAWGETARTAIEALSARRLRSALTILGILIGIAAVMLTVGLGQSATTEVANQINSLGSNLLTLSPGGSMTQMGNFRMRQTSNSLTMEDAKMLADKAVAPHISAVAPVATGNANLQSSTTTWTSSTVGTSVDWLTVRNHKVETGRFFSQEEYDAGTSVAVIGPDTADELFDQASPVGESIQVNGQTFTVIGVLATADSSLSSEDDIVVVPLTTAEARLGASPVGLSMIYLSAQDSDSLSLAYQEVNQAMLTSHGVTEDNSDFSLSTMSSLVDAMASILGTLTLVLGAIAAISLLVGGIGVMNIMLVSVSERVREIGLRKALGATPAIIRRQFLVEAGVLGLTGGALGMALGYAGAAAISVAVDMAIGISLGAAFIALAVSLTIGLVAGVYPASRAAQLAPIDALRSE